MPWPYSYFVRFNRTCLLIKKYSGTNAQKRKASSDKCLFKFGEPRTFIPGKKKPLKSEKVYGATGESLEKVCKHSQLLQDGLFPQGGKINKENINPSWHKQCRLFMSD